MCPGREYYTHKSCKFSSGWFAETDWAQALPSSSASSWFEVVPKGSERYLIPLVSFILTFKNGFPMSYPAGMHERYTKENKEVVHAVTATWKAPKLRSSLVKSSLKSEANVLWTTEKKSTLGERSRAGGRKPHNASCLMEPCHTGHQSMLVLILWLIWWFHVYIMYSRCSFPTNPLTPLSPIPVNLPPPNLSPSLGFAFCDPVSLTRTIFVVTGFGLLGKILRQVTLSAQKRKKNPLGQI